MNKKSTKQKCDTKGIKEMILFHASAVFYNIGARSGKGTKLAEELTMNALDRMLDLNKGNQEEFKELTAIACMLRGIADNLRLFEKSEVAPEQDKKFSMFDDDDQPF